MTDIQALRDDIDLHIAGTDPNWSGIFTGVTSDELVADAYNALTQDAPQVTIAEVINFLMLDNVHSTDGSDTQDRTIWQRMKEVVALAVTPSAAVADPWGSTTIGNITEIQQLKTHELLDYFTLSAQGNLPIDIASTNFQVLLAGAQSAGCMSTTQETAFLALGNNLQSRQQEIFDLLQGPVKTHQVTQARALP